MEIKQGSACFPRFPKFLTVALMLIETEQSLVAAWLSGLRPALSRGIAPAHHAWLGTEAAPGTLEGWACGTRSIGLQGLQGQYWNWWVRRLLGHEKLKPFSFGVVCLATKTNRGINRTALEDHLEQNTLKKISLIMKTMPMPTE